jgi:hypothetical protein
MTQSDIKNAGNHGIDSILRVLMRHQLLAVGHFNPDCVGTAIRGPTHDDSQPDGRWERRERFPIFIFGQDAFENLLPELVRLDFALLASKHRVRTHLAVRRTRARFHLHLMDYL